MKVIITDEHIEIYREDDEKAFPGDSCREFAEWAKCWAIQRLADSNMKSIEDPGSGGSVLCD